LRREIAGAISKAGSSTLAEIAKISKVGEVWEEMENGEWRMEFQRHCPLPTAHCPLKAHIEKILKIIDSRVVAIRKVDVVSIVAYGLHARNLQWLCLSHGNDWKCQRLCNNYLLGLLLFAKSARAGTSKQGWRVLAAAIVAPTNDNVIVDSFDGDWSHTHDRSCFFLVRE
jgi:hypothetical protein